MDRELELGSGENIHKDVINHNGMSADEFKDFIYPLTVKDFAELIDMPRSTVGQWASGRRRVPRLMINNISKRKVLLHFEYKKCESSRRRLKKELANGTGRAVEFQKKYNLK